MQRPVCIATAMCSSQMSSCVDQPAYIVCISDVDPYIGFGDIGHVFKGTNTPFVAAQLGLTDSSRSCSGHSIYHRSDTKVCYTQVAETATYITSHSSPEQTISGLIYGVASNITLAWFESGRVGKNGVRLPFMQILTSKQ